MAQTVTVPDIKPDRDPDQFYHFERMDGEDIDVTIYDSARGVQAIVVACDGREWVCGVHDGEAILDEMPPVWLCRVARQLGLDGARRLIRESGDI